LGYSAAGVDGSGLTGTIYNAAADQPPDLQTALNPKITSQPFLALSAGGTYSYQVAATNPGNGTLSYALTQGPTGMAVTSAGLTSWTATFTSKRVKITVSDGKGGQVVHGFLLPVNTALATGTTVNLSGLQGDLGYANITVPSSGATVLQTTLRGGSGGSTYMALFDPKNTIVGISTRSGNNQSLSIPNPAAGTWSIQILGVKDFNSVALTANLVTPTLISGNGTVTGLTGSDGDETF